MNGGFNNTFSRNLIAKKFHDYMMFGLYACLNEEKLNWLLIV